MLDIIKYSSLEFREHEGQCIPRGPSFERAKTAKVLLPQCIFEFRAPRHAPLRRHAIDQYMVVPGKHYDLENTSSIGKLIPDDCWKGTRICIRNWAFYGPWFTGYMGDVHCSMKAVGTREINSSVNFLYPSALETAVQGFVTAYIGYKVYDEERETPYYKGPINWSPIRGFGVPAVQFDIQGCFVAGSRSRYVFFPVSRDRLMVISFNYGQNCTGNWEEMDAKISPEPMRNLINSIISSIRLTPSPELQAEIDKAKAACGGNYSVSSECPPYKWPADVDKDGLTILDYREDRYKR